MPFEDSDPPCFDTGSDHNVPATISSWSGSNGLLFHMCILLHNLLHFNQLYLISFLVYHLYNLLFVSDIFNCQIGWSWDTTMYNKNFVVNYMSNWHPSKYFSKIFKHEMIIKLIFTTIFSYDFISESIPNIQLETFMISSVDVHKKGVNQLIYKQKKYTLYRSTSLVNYVSVEKVQVLLRRSAWKGSNQVKRCIFIATVQS